MRLVGVGWYIGLCVFVGVWGGLWLDSRLNTKPALVIAGLIIGIAAAIYGVYRMLLPSMRNRQNKESN
jgi:F0F1-type ATP synthase assembly protein I